MNTYSSFVRENWFKLSVMVILTIAVLGYINNLNSQNKLDELKRLDVIKTQSIERDAKANADKQTYVASQKKACLDIYVTESKKYTNARSWDYDAVDDQCLITYKDPSPKTIQECRDKFPILGLTGPELLDTLRNNLSCQDGDFIKTF